MKTYTIEIMSRGLDVGIGKITQAQYEYWSDQDDYDLSEALQSGEDFDYDELDTPEDARFNQYYNEFTDVFFAFGPDFDYHSITIKDDEGNIIYMGDVEGLTSEHDPEFELEMIDGGDRDYFISDMEPGYYVSWSQGGKGLYFDGEFEAESFDPKKLKFHRKETDYGDVLSDVSYDGEELYNCAGDYDIKSFEARVHYVE